MRRCGKRVTDPLTHLCREHLIEEAELLKSKCKQIDEIINDENINKGIKKGLCFNLARCYINFDIETMTYNLSTLDFRLEKKVRWRRQNG